MSLMPVLRCCPTILPTEADANHILDAVEQLSEGHGAFVFFRPRSTEHTVFLCALTSGTLAVSTVLGGISVIPLALQYVGLSRIGMHAVQSVIAGRLSPESTSADEHTVHCMALSALLGALTCCLGCDASIGSAALGVGVCLVDVGTGTAFVVYDMAQEFFPTNHPPQQHDAMV
jgi:hypothetical protein